MVASAGREIRIKYSSTVIAGARADSITTAIETIDITDKDDSGIVTLLDDIATKSFSMSCEGVMKDAILLGLADSAGKGTTLNDLEIIIGGLGTYAGKFAITNFESSGSEGTDPMTFTCSFVSSGAITWTAA